MIASKKTGYATQPKPLRNQITKLLQDARQPTVEGTLCALIVPDSNSLAGGPIAAEVYKALKDHTFETVILIAPSHTGLFERLSICSLDTYHTPLGELEVNDRVRNELCDEDDDIYLDDTGHFQPDGIDVQLPFLQAMLSEFDIVPIVMGEESPAYCRELGNAVGEIMYNRPTLVVACADIVDTTEENLERFRTYLEAQDVSRVMTLLNSEQVHMMGRGPVLVALLAALHRRANHVKVLQATVPENGTPGFLGAMLWRG